METPNDVTVEQEDIVMLDGQEIKLPKKLSEEQMDDYFSLEEEPTIDLTEILEATQQLDLGLNEQ